MARTGALQNNGISLKLNEHPGQDMFINITSIYSWKGGRERGRITKLGNCWQMLG